MRPHILAIGGFAVLLTIAIPGFSARAHSDSEVQPFAKRGIRVGVLFPRISIEGDFDGRSAHVSTDAILSVPSIDPAFGYGLSVGGKEDRYSLDVNFQRTKHNATLPSGATRDANFLSYNIDLKVFFFIDKRLQPFLLVGWVPYARLDVVDGSSDFTGRSGTGTFESELSGYNLGLGLEWFVTDRLAVTGGFFYRRLAFEDAKGIDAKPFVVKDGGHGYNVLTAVSYTFGNF